MRLKPCPHVSRYFRLFTASLFTHVKEKAIEGSTRQIGVGRGLKVPTIYLVKSFVYAGVRFSRDSLIAFIDRIKIRENGGLWTVYGYFWIRNIFFLHSKIFPSTHYRIRCGFIIFHSGERADSKISGFDGWAWMEAVSRKKKLQIQKYPDMRWGGLYHLSFSRIISHWSISSV